MRCLKDFFCLFLSQTNSHHVKCHTLVHKYLLGLWCRHLGCKSYASEELHINRQKVQKVVVKVDWSLEPVQQRNKSCRAFLLKFWVPHDKRTTNEANPSLLKIRVSNFLGSVDGFHYLQYSKPRDIENSSIKILFSIASLSVN